jgi:hypothetical protein
MYLKIGVFSHSAIDQIFYIRGYNCWNKKKAG